MKNENPKLTYERLLHKQLGTALSELHTLCALQKAPEEVTRLFTVEGGVPGSVRDLIDRTLEEHPAKFLE
jgi:hypothetical protein